MEATRPLDAGSGRLGALPGARFLAQPAGRRRIRLALLLAILTAIAAGSATWSYQPAAFHGRVVDVEGKPVEGVSVTLLAGRARDATGSGDSSGRWTVEGGHRIDAHRLLLTAPGYLPLTWPDPGQRPLLSVLHRLPELAGTVKDETGAAVVGATLVLKQPSSPVEWSLTSGADGAFAFRGTLAPGTYLVEVTAPEHDSYLATVDLVADGRSKVSPLIPRQLGTLVLTSNPGGTAPQLDGKPLPGCGSTPCTVSIPIGRHVLSISNDLYVPWSQQFEVADHQSIPIAAALVRKTGTLHVTAAGGGELWIDGDQVATGPWSGAVPTGDHSLAYRSATSWPQFGSVRIDWNHDSTTNFGKGTAITPGDQATFLAGLDAYLHAAGGQYGIYLRDLKTGAELGYHQDDVMEAASDIKVPLALYLLHQVEAGAVKFDDEVILQDSDFMGGTGVLDYSAAAGDKFAVGDLLRLLIQQSDNTAWQALQRMLGATAIDSYAATIGAPDCHQVDDNCTAHEEGIMFTQLYAGKLLNSADTALLVLLLENTAFNDRINYYLGGIAVAHKTGADGGVMNDVGIVYAPGGPVLVSVFTQTGSGTVQPIRDVARAALRYFRG
jgi:beta-lactamase class A